MSEAVRSIGEIGFGIVFSIGAIFNLTYTLRNGEEFSVASRIVPG